MSEKKKKMAEISLEEIPAKVMEVVDQVMPGGTIEKAGKREKENKVSYKVKKAVEAGTYLIMVSADGVLLEVVREDIFKRRWNWFRRGKECHKHNKSHHGEGRNENSSSQRD
ncbi:hypothetical protein H8E77_02195 [bacterium]|nr:hypothetical protein [bacterium]